MVLILIYFVRDRSGQPIGFTMLGLTMSHSKKSLLLAVSCRLPPLGLEPYLGSPVKTTQGDESL